MPSTRSVTLLQLAAAALALAATAPASPARADEEPSLPVIAGGREKDVMALLQPYVLGADLGGGWKLETVQISGTYFRVLALGPGGAEAALRMELPKRSPSAETTPSFAVHRESGVIDGGTASAGAVDLKVLDPVVAAIRKNDTGKFWPEKGPTVPKFEAPQGTPLGTGSRGGPGTSPSPGSPEDPQAELTRNARRILVGVGVLVAFAVLLIGRRRKPS